MLHKITPQGFKIPIGVVSSKNAQINPDNRSSYLKLQDQKKAQLVKKKYLENKLLEEGNLGMEAFTKLFSPSTYIGGAARALTGKGTFTDNVMSGSGFGNVGVNTLFDLTFPFVLDKGIGASNRFLSNWATKRQLNNALSLDSYTPELTSKVVNWDYGPLVSKSYYKPWRSSWGALTIKGNNATAYYFKNEPNLYFELVDDLEPATHSVHFKTTLGTLPLDKKMALFLKVADEVPEGHTISTYGHLSKGGIHGVERFGKDFEFLKIGERLVTDRLMNPITISIFLKPRTSHVQGDDAIAMFRLYGGTPIQENSINGQQLRAYVNEARERYGLVGNTNITDEEIAEALYKQANELGSGSAAINALGEPQLLFRADTQPYTLLKDRLSPTELQSKSGTMDNSLGTLFLGELPGTGQQTRGLERYLVRGLLFNGKPQLIGSGTGANVIGADGEVHSEITLAIPKDATKLVTYNTRFGDNTVYKLPAKYSESGTNDINAFIVRTPAVRDASKEISVLNDDYLIQNGSKVDYHGTPNSTNERAAMAEHYNYVLNDALKKQLGLLKSNPNSFLRDEHDDYTYFAVPNWNKQNVKHLLSYDLRIPRNWNDPNIFRIGIPIIGGTSLLSNAK